MLKSARFRWKWLRCAARWFRMSINLCLLDLVDNSVWKRVCSSAYTYIRTYFEKWNGQNTDLYSFIAATFVNCTMYAISSYLNMSQINVGSSAVGHKKEKSMPGHNLPCISECRCVIFLNVRLSAIVVFVLWTLLSLGAEKQICFHVAPKSSRMYMYTTIGRWLYNCGKDNSDRRILVVGTKTSSPTLRRNYISLTVRRFHARWSHPVCTACN